MAKIILNIPDNEFGVDIQNKFQDFFGRVKAEIDNRVKVGDTLICGAYEIETAEMFLKAFEQMEIVDDSTLEESISLLKANVMVACDTSPKVGYNTPLNKAVKALEQQENKGKVALIKPSQNTTTLRQLMQPSDCVSRKAMLNAITEIDNNVNMDIYTNEVREIVKELPPVTPTRRWNPVNERLPEVGEKVLCQCQANIYEVLKLTVDGWYHDNNHCYMSGFVIAWQPLPKPYEEKRGNEDENYII